MKALLISEDFRNDQYVAPILLELMRASGDSSPKLEVCRDPLLCGVAEAMKWEKLEEIIEMYRYCVDIFFLLVDRDGVESRGHGLSNLESKAKAKLGSSRKVLLTENAWQEVEVWILAGHQLPADWEWRRIRAEPHPKEVYFQPYAALRGVQDHPGGGRKTLAREAAGSMQRLFSLCPEDLSALRDRLKAWREERA